MVIRAPTFPVLRLIRILHKPILTKLVKHTVDAAKVHPVLRNTFLIPPAQKFHQLHIRLNAHVKNREVPKRVKPLQPDEAIDLGARMLCEGVIVITVAISIIQELARRKQKHRAQEAHFKDTYKDVLDIAEELSRKYAEMQKTLDELSEEIKQLKVRMMKKKN